MTSQEPRENISGETESLDVSWPAPDASDPIAQHVVYRLGELYWRKTYGDRPAFSCLVRTILSQNTSDKASQPAFDALEERVGEEDFARALTRLPPEVIAETIKSAGLYNQKAQVLTSVAETVLADFGDADGFDDFIAEASYDDARTYLLEMTGVGPKTADCVLLFAGGTDGVFPVDTHVYRIARRLGIAPADADHETVREHLEGTVDPGACGFGHTSMIQFGREYCNANSPACLDGPEACPLWDLCDRVGVDPDDGGVVDPAEVE